MRCNSEMALVKHVVEEGLLAGDFEGFEDEGTVFAFVVSGRQWRQAEIKYVYYYAYMPRARVIRDRGRCYLEVVGMRERVLVQEDR